MSIRLMSAVFESKTLGPTERLIMLALADHADDDGRCYPSIQRLAERTGLSVRAVQTNLRKLVDEGYVTIVPGGGRSSTNVYFISANPAVRAPFSDINPAADAPRSRCTPAADAPFSDINPAADARNPAAGAPEPSRTTIETKEPLCVSPEQFSGDPPAEARPDPPPRSPPKRASPLAQDWAPSDRNIDDARSRNFTDQEISHEAERFRDYHLAKGTAFKDWDAGWRTWLGNARRFAPSRGALGGPLPFRGGQPAGLVGAAMRSRAERGL